MNELKKFLDGVSGKESDDLISNLTVKQLEVLMSLSEFATKDGLSESVINFGDTLGKKGYKVDDPIVVELFQKGCLKWKTTSKTYSVHQSLCGKANKDAIVKRYVNLKRGGDGSDSFKGILDGMNADA